MWAPNSVVRIVFGAFLLFSLLFSYINCTGKIQINGSLSSSSNGSSSVFPNSSPVPQVGLGLHVDVGLNRNPISPLIYGMNFANEKMANAVHLPVRRWGGDATSRYNYQFDESNAGADWYYEGDPATSTPGTTLPDGSSFDQFVEQNNRTQTTTLGTVPSMGWVAKSKTQVCGFAVSKYGAQQQQSPYSNCGNGILPNGTNITGNDPTDTSVAITPSFVSGWISYLVNKYGPGSKGGVGIWGLDNEPMLWYGTHRDIHPNPTTYDELKNVAYSMAPAIKAADPTAKVSGPSVFGWRAYFNSALDWQNGWNTAPYLFNSNPVDENAHGGIPFLEWYLQQMHTYEQRHGLRILDYLDIHAYPCDNVGLQTAGSATTQALRLQATRFLWDPTYMCGGEINTDPDIIPRMHQWVNGYYPGTKISISEYNFGGLEDINGALAQADTLGIFGQQQLDMATLWGPPTDGQPGQFAFSIYTNYDGSGSAFGDIGVSATSGNQIQLAVYASQRSIDDAVTIMVINKTSGNLTSSVSLNGYIPTTNTALVFQYSAANLNAIVQSPSQAVTPGGFVSTFLANSITLFIVR